MRRKGMKRTGWVTILAVTAGLVALVGGPAQAATFVVDDDGAECSTPYTTIQAAVDAAADGDTVNVCPGTYVETVMLSKMLTLNGAQAGVDARSPRGSESTIAPGAGRGIELKTGSAGSRIDGFTVGEGFRSIGSTSGALDGLTIANNRIVDFDGGAVLLNHPGVDITMDRNLFDGSATTGFERLVHLSPESYDGFWFTNNVVRNGPNAGLYSDGNRNIGESGTRFPKVNGNLFEANDIGADLGSRALEFAEVLGNTFRDNGTGMRGGPADSLIADNLFEDNGAYGLDLTGVLTAPANRGAQRNIVTANTFTGNGHTPDPVDGGGAIFFDTSQPPGTHPTNQVHGNNIEDNPGVGARYNGIETIDITCNWWGEPSGPSGAGMGSGDEVMGMTLEFEPWLTAPAPDGECDGQRAPKVYKQEARDALAAKLPTGSYWNDKWIAKAIGALNDSLKSYLWESDGAHLNDKWGHKVFEHEKEAVHFLMKVSPPTDVSEEIETILDVDRRLAQTAIDDVYDEIAMGGHSPWALAKANRELDEAEEEMDEAADERADGDHDDAVHDYGEAWKHAQKALDHLGGHDHGHHHWWEHFDDDWRWFRGHFWSSWHRFFNGH